MPRTSGYIEGLKRILGHLAQLATEPDADPAVIGQLQQALVTVIRAGSSGDPAMQAASMGGPGGVPGAAPPDAGAMAGGGMAGPPPTPAAAGMAGPGAPMGGLTPAPTDMDEIRRLLTSPRPG